MPVSIAPGSIQIQVILSPTSIDKDLVRDVRALFEVEYAVKFLFVKDEWILEIFIKNPLFLDKFFSTNLNSLKIEKKLISKLFFKSL